MDKLDIFRAILDCRKKLEEAYDLWNKMPPSIQNELEHLFSNNQGVGYHVDWALSSLKDIHAEDIDEAFEKCNGGVL